MTSGCKTPEADHYLKSDDDYNFQNEPAVITIDNINQFMGHQGRPDVFDVNVQTILKTREAQKRLDLV